MRLLFLPQAQQKGCSSTIFGLIIGMNCLMSFLVTPCIGKKVRSQRVKGTDGCTRGERQGKGQIGRVNQLNREGGRNLIKERTRIGKKRTNTKEAEGCIFFSLFFQFDFDLVRAIHFCFHRSIICFFFCS